ncbi:Pyruvate kinase [Cynara cardunculus var. scolymus]|uniref:Pyruvate kinase n=1 Tax=Cynara cardunculus var. scolymus TaxID=59895 RepID=A0A118JV30_CYNCS|nr:Pyruvate kinase [Cynara cardunculus var. scolymus]
METINLRNYGISQSFKSYSDRRLSSSKRSSQSFYESISSPQQRCVRKSVSLFPIKSMKIVEQNQEPAFSPNGPIFPSSDSSSRQAQISSDSQRKTKIVCTIGPSTSSREMIWKLAEMGMNVARLNMSHGDHASHQKTIDIVKEYNAQFKEKVIAIMLDTKGPEVRSGDVPQPILLQEGQEFNFTIKRGVSMKDTVSVNYDDFINDVEPGDILLVDGGMMSLAVQSKTKDLVKCKVIDGGELKSRRHLNVRGKSATLPSITDKDWEDIKFGVDNLVDFYAVSFVKDAEVVHELKDYLKSNAMVARGDLGAELPIEEVPLLQEDIIRRCRNMQKPVIVATNMLESMIDHPTPTRAEVSDIAIAVRQAVKVMHTVAMRTESRSPIKIVPPIRQTAYKSHMGEMFGFHASTMADTLATPIIVFTRTGSMARLILYHGVMPIYMEFSDDAEETFERALESGKGRTLCDSCSKWSATNLATRVYSPHTSSYGSRLTRDKKTLWNHLVLQCEPSSSSNSVGPTRTPEFKRDEGR